MKYGQQDYGEEGDEEEQEYDDYGELIEKETSKNVMYVPKKKPATTDQKPAATTSQVTPSDTQEQTKDEIPRDEYPTNERQGHYRENRGEGD